MPLSFNGFGLKAKHSPSGVIRPQRFVVPASDIINNIGSWNSFFQDDAVYVDTNGRIQPSNSALATGTIQCIGSFSGVEFNDSNGRRTVSNQFNKNVIFNPVANQGLGTTDVWFWLYTDPELVYEVQLAGAPGGVGGAPSGAFTTTNPNFALEGNLLGYSTDSISAGPNAPNPVVGFSTGFAFAPTGTAANCPLIVYNLAYDNQPNNAYNPGTPTGINGNSWSDPYPNVLVRLANAQFNGALPSGF